MSALAVAAAQRKKPSRSAPSFGKFVSEVAGFVGGPPLNEGERASAQTAYERAYGRTKRGSALARAAGSS